MSISDRDAGEDRRTGPILHVVGARPNFMKVARLLPALEECGVENVLVHTGQHYDDNMSGTFFDQLNIQEPDYYLGAGSGSHTRQTATVMTAMEPVVEEVKPSLVVVVGDVNSTLAAALTAAQRNVPVAHVEAGLRSGDWSMPEEKNRVLTDRLSQLLFTPSSDADENLRAEGIPEERIHRVGNIMIDVLVTLTDEADAVDVKGQFGIEGHRYAVATLHRPSNVDDARQLREIVRGLDQVAEMLPVLLPLHPRTDDRLKQFGISFEHVRTVEPVGYVEMLALMKGASVVLTDSGGVQEETTVLGIPCLTLRANTERPVTVTHGTNHIVAERTASGITAAVESVLSDPPPPRCPELWDGRTANRIAEVLIRWHRTQRTSAR